MEGAGLELDFLTRLPIAEDNETLKLKLNSYLDLLQALADASDNSPPTNFVLPSLKIVGVAGEFNAKIEFQFDIEILDTTWTSIPLLNTDCAVLTTQVKRSGEPIDAFFAVRNDSHNLLLEKEGKYKVICNVEAPYTKERGGARSLVLGLPSQPSCGAVEFSVSGEGEGKWQITATPSLSATVAHVDEGTASLAATFAPTAVLTLQWTKVVRSVAPVVPTASEQKGEEIVTADQETCYVVGEGVMTVTGSYRFTLVHTSKRRFLISLDPRVNVLSVEAEGMRKWHVVEGADASRPDVWSRVSDAKTLHIDLNYAVVDSFKVTVVSEMALGDASKTLKDLALPASSCLDVARERAHLVIETKASVEVQEASASNVTPMDISELPSTLRQSTQNALSAYKTLTPSDASVLINVTKHNDTDVLLTVIEKAHHEATVSSEGKALHRIRAEVRNTQRQYLRCVLPCESSVWSTVVGGKPMKPALDSDGRLMVPLLKSHGQKKGGSFVLEIVFLTEIAEMNLKGELALEFAQLDIPVNMLLVTARLPKEFFYDKFQGDLLPTNSFSVSDHFETAPAGGDANDFVPMQQQQMMMPQYQQQQSLTSNLNMSYSSAAPKMKARKKVGHGAGMVPVKVDVPEIGVPWKFEKLLVTDEPQRVSVRYKKRKVQGFCRGLCCPWR